MLIHPASISDTEVLVNLMQVLQRKSADANHATVGVHGGRFYRWTERLLGLLRPAMSAQQMPSVFGVWTAMLLECGVSEVSDDGCPHDSIYF